MAIKDYSAGRFALAGICTFLILRSNRKRQTGPRASGHTGWQAADYDPEKDDPWFQHLNGLVATRNAEWPMAGYNMKHVVRSAGVVTTSAKGRCYWALAETVAIDPTQAMMEGTIPFHVYGVCPSGGAIEVQAGSTQSSALEAMMCHMQGKPIPGQAYDA